MLKTSVSQLLAAGSASISTFCFGISIGFPTILIPELYKEDAEIVVTLAEITWIGSLNFFCQPLGALASGPIQRYLGRRKILALSSIPYAIAWLLLSFSGSSVWPIFLGFILFGLTSGFVEGPIQIYISEVSEPRLRGSNSTLISTSISFGLFIPILMGSFIYWRTLALINFIIPIIGFVAMWFVPESPYWLASKGRITESQNALAWLRGWTTSENVSSEFSMILEFSKPRKSDENFKLTIRRYFRRSVLLPFGIVTFAFFIFAFGGSIPLLAYAVPIFEKLESPIDEYIASILLAGLQAITTTSLIFVIPLLGKRKPIFASVGVAGTSMMIVVIYTFLKEQEIIDQIQGAKYSWIPTTCLIISILAGSFGIKSIPWIMAGEVFPLDVRAGATGIIASTSNIYCAISSKIFIYMTKAINLSGTFLFWAIINFIGLVVLYYVMPETEGRSLSDIERYFEGCKDDVEDEKRRTGKGDFKYDNTAYD